MENPHTDKTLGWATRRRLVPTRTGRARLSPARRRVGREWFAARWDRRALPSPGVVHPTAWAVIPRYKVRSGLWQILKNNGILNLKTAVQPRMHTDFMRHAFLTLRVIRWSSASAWEISTTMMKVGARTTRIWSAVTCHRFGDLSPKQGRVQRPGTSTGRPRACNGDKSPARKRRELAALQSRWWRRQARQVHQCPSGVELRFLG